MHGGCKTKAPACVELEEQILLNNLTVMRLSSLSFFPSFASNRSRQWCDWGGLRAEKSLQMFRENLLNVQPTFLLPGSLFPHRLPPVRRCNIHSEMQLRRLNGLWADSSGSRAAASPGEGTDAAGTQQRRNASWLHAFLHIFLHSVRAYQRYPVILHALLVCCALLFPLILLITHTALNKGAGKNVEWIRRRFTSQQVRGGGWGVCSVPPNYPQLENIQIFHSGSHSEVPGSTRGL